jgi:hypothetical protein
MTFTVAEGKSYGFTEEKACDPRIMDESYSFTAKEEPHAFTELE